MANMRSKARRWGVGSGVVLGALTVGVLTVAGGGSAGAAPAVPSASGGVAVERALLCELRPEKIRGLRGAGAAASDPEGLRDAVWLLEERIAEWRAGAQGDVKAEALVGQAEAIAASWREALAAHDSGQGAVSRSVLARSAGQLTSLEARLKQSPVAGCK